MDTQEATMLADARTAKYFETAPGSTRPATTTTLPDEGSRIRFAILFLALGLVSLGIASLKPWGNITAYLITFLFASVAIAYIVSNRDALLAKIFFTTLVAGWVKLYADWYLVVAASSLVYAQEGPFVLSSPLYMPFFWASLLWAITLITRWIDLRYGLLAAMAGGLAIGALNLPVYELLAASAGWLIYRDVSLPGHSPLYLIGAGSLVTAALPLLGRVVELGDEIESLGMGLVIGAWIYLAIRLGLVLVG